MEGQRPIVEWRDEASRVRASARVVKEALGEHRLHPEEERTILERSKDGQKPVPWEQVKKDLGL